MIVEPELKPVTKQEEYEQFATETVTKVRRVATTVAAYALIIYFFFRVIF